MTSDVPTPPPGQTASGQTSPPGQTVGGQTSPPPALQPMQPAVAPSTPNPGLSSMLPGGVVPASPWARLGAYLLEGVLAVVTLGVGWLIWAAMIGGTGQTPAKRLLNLRVIGGDSLRPVGLGRMFWMRGLLAGIVASLAVTFTAGILLFMPFWDRRNQNVWDKVSNTYVVTDPNDAWQTKPAA